MVTARGSGSEDPLSLVLASGDGLTVAGAAAAIASTPSEQEQWDLSAEATAHMAAARSATLDAMDAWAEDVGSVSSTRAASEQFHATDQALSDIDVAVCDDIAPSALDYWLYATLEAESSACAAEAVADGDFDAAEDDLSRTALYGDDVGEAGRAVAEEMGK